MNDVPTPEASFDTLGDRAAGGDGRAEAVLFEELRVRFLTITKRRVQPDHVEDVVQDALRIILGKYRERSRDCGLLVWSLTVLRNVIGNHYQTRRRETERTTQVEDWQRIGEETPCKDPSGGLDHDETAGLLENAVAELARRSPRCGDIFRHILESHERGGGQREISQRAFETVCLEHPDLTRNTFYVALHRCRAQLRSLMDRMETGVGHA